MSSQKLRPVQKSAPGLLVRFTVLNCPSLQQSIGPRCEKTCLRRGANNKGADQPAHPRSLISAFVIRFLECVISKLVTSELSFF